MSDLAPFPDIEAALLDLLSDLGTTGAVTPDDLQDHLPFIRVHRIGGSDNRFTDVARVDVDVYAASRASAFTVAETARQRLLAAPHHVGSVVIDTVSTESAPYALPWADPNVRRFYATYQLSARR